VRYFETYSSSLSVVSCVIKIFFSVILPSLHPNTHPQFPQKHGNRHQNQSCQPSAEINQDILHQAGPSCKRLDILINYRNSQQYKQAHRNVVSSPQAAKPVHQASDSTAQNAKLNKMSQLPYVLVKSCIRIVGIQKRLQKFRNPAAERIRGFTILKRIPENKANRENTDQKNQS